MKVGDRVKIKSLFCSKIGTIIRIRKGYILKYLVKTGEKEGWYSKAELQKVKEE